MNIVLAGAGEVGLNLAQSLATENHDIAVIDSDAEHLEYISSSFDVLTVHGDASSIEVLKRAGIENTDLFMAITSTEQTNLLAAIIAKRLGAKQTIARVANPEYLSDAQKNSFEEMGVDKLFSPRQLAVREISRLLQRTAFSDVFEFGGGKIFVVGFTVDTTSPLDHKTLIRIVKDEAEFPLRVITVLRDDITYIPDGDFVIKSGDHIYLSVLSRDLKKVNMLVGKKLKKVKRVMIVGGTKLALSTAKKLENQYKLSIITHDKEQAKRFVSGLENSLVIVGNPSDTDLLREEGIEGMDAFIALTDKSETNIISSLLAEELGVFKTIALVDNNEYIRLSQHIGIDTFINKKNIAANYIYRFVRQGKIEAITSMHGVDAETIEYEMTNDNKMTSELIKDLPLQGKAVIAGVLRENEAMIPDGLFQIRKGDKIIVMVPKEYIPELEAMFA